jgi:hypothetical protein
VNWLTSQVSELTSFADLAGRGLSTPDPTLRQVPYDAVREILGSRSLVIDGDFSLDQGFLLAEDARSAAERAARAVTADPGMAPPPTFTLALDDGAGTVVYLPEGLRHSADLQLFTFAGERLSRFRVRGRFDARSARMSRLEGVAPTACPDGPCVDWGQVCGAGCICNKFEVDEQLASIDVAPQFRLRGGHTYELRCVNSVHA